MVDGRGANYYECSYTSLPQCNASASGRYALCEINPYFAGVAGPAGYRRHRRVYQRMNASGAALADRGWQRAFDDPIALPNGRELVTERGGPTMLARIGMMRALKAGKPGPEITPRRKRAKRYRVIQ